MKTGCAAEQWGGVPIGNAVPQTTCPAFPFRRRDANVLMVVHLPMGMECYLLRQCNVCTVQCNLMYGTLLYITQYNVMLFTRRWEWNVRMTFSAWDLRMEFAAWDLRMGFEAWDLRMEFADLRDLPETNGTHLLSSSKLLRWCG